MTVPGYWFHETTGVLRPVVERYIHGHSLQPHEIPIMRAYLRQWIAADGFRGPAIAQLRATVDAIVDHDSLRAWIDAAVDAGVDPL